MFFLTLVNFTWFFLHEKKHVSYTSGTSAWGGTWPLERKRKQRNLPSSAVARWLMLMSGCSGATVPLPNDLKMASKYRLRLKHDRSIGCNYDRFNYILRTYLDPMWGKFLDIRVYLPNCPHRHTPCRCFPAYAG